MVSRLKLVGSEALRSLGSNLSTTFAATMTVLIGMFLLGLVVALGTWINSWSDHVKKQLEVKVFFTDDVAPSQVKTVRIYLANLTEFDLINSFHLHADFFRYQPTGTGDAWEYTDTVMQCQGQRGVLELRFANRGRFMFHAHQSEFTELGWMGFFEVV